jgi:transcriptional regulator with XRE-family HTH domain
MVKNKPNDKLVEQGEQIVKKKRGGKTASVKHNTSAKADDIRRIGATLLKWYNMEKAVTDEEIRKRLEMYFVETLKAGEIPTVEEMCLALGYPRQTIWRWETGEEGSTPARRDLIKKAKELLASFDAKMVQEGKINPVTYIFRAKNYFGLQDKQEYVLTPNNPLGDHTDPENIKKRLIEGVADGE